MDELEDFPISLAENEAIEPMMQIPSELPSLPLRDIVIYPFMIVPLFVSRDKSIRAVEEALQERDSLRVRQPGGLRPRDLIGVKVHDVPAEHAWQRPGGAASGRDRGGSCEGAASSSASSSPPTRT